MKQLTPISKSLHFNALKIVSEYDREIQQTQTADSPMAPLGRATQVHSI